MTQLLDDHYRLVLFDLDGTLVDTAPDMVAVLQSMQRERGLDPAEYEVARRYVSHGALGLLGVGFPDEEPEFNGRLHQEYLQRYSEDICRHSSLFDGLSALLEELETRGCPWGVVTNKPAQLTLPLLAALELDRRLTCVVSGDTLAVRKPDPAPVLLACEQAGVDPALTIYVGDADRDIEAGRNAGTATVAAAFGYITEDDDPREWEADVIAESTHELRHVVCDAVASAGSS